MFYPYEVFAKWLIYSVFSIQKDSYLGSSLEFFVFDVLKIFTLLFVLIYLVSFFRSFISKNKLQKVFTHERKYLGHFLAASLGIITPFCSCSAIPLFLSFLEIEIPIGIAFTFLIASPLINEVAIILLLGLFGVRTMLIYILSGFVISIIAGLILGKMKVDKWLLKDILYKQTLKNSECCKCQKLFKNRFANAKKYTFSIIKKIGLYVLLGIGLGAWIHGYVPNDFLVKYADASKWYAVPLSVILGIPLYSNAAGVIPLISSLVEKGLAIGTALAFIFFF